MRMGNTSITYDPWEEWDDLDWSFSVDPYEAGDAFLYLSTSPPPYWSPVQYTDVYTFLGLSNSVLLGTSEDE